MENSNIASFPNLHLSHFELYVKNVASMENFYTNHLGFIITDRGEGKDAMVFLSRNPNEHHQLVLNPRLSDTEIESPIDHISFRVNSISSLRIFHEILKTRSTTFQTVSHGTTWSIYLQDPEENRIEIFADTPWYVSQPCRFEIDFDLSNEELIKFTEDKIKELPGFEAIKIWEESHLKSIKNENIK